MNAAISRSPRRPSHQERDEKCCNPSRSGDEECDDIVISKGPYNRWEEILEGLTQNAGMLQQDENV